MDERDDDGPFVKSAADLDDLLAFCRMLGRHGESGT
jgi:hypothetical protein